MNEPTTPAEPIPYGYAWHDGTVLSNDDTDMYNAYTRAIELAYYESSKEEWREIRHRFITRCMYEASVKRTIETLKEQKCFAPDGRLALYPTWLDMRHLDAAVSLKLITRKHYPHFYSHTDYHLTTP